MRRPCTALAELLGATGLPAHQLLLGEKGRQSHRTCDAIGAKESHCVRPNRAAHFFQEAASPLSFQGSAAGGQPHSPVRIVQIITTLLSCYSYQLPFVIVSEAL